MTEIAPLRMASYCLSNTELQRRLLCPDRGILVQDLVMNRTIRKGIAQDFMTVKWLETFSEMEDSPLHIKLTQEKVTDGSQILAKAVDLGSSTPGSISLCILMSLDMVF